MILSVYDFILKGIKRLVIWFSEAGVIEIHFGKLTLRVIILQIQPAPPSHHLCIIFNIY